MVHASTVNNFTWVERTTEWPFSTFSYSNGTTINLSASSVLSSPAVAVAAAATSAVVLASTPSNIGLGLEPSTRDDSTESEVAVSTTSATPTVVTPYSPAASVAIALVLLCVIVGTIVGNILVCVAVCLVRKLRRPCNYLLVSLAVSDLCVAILVMPVALLFEISGEWSFGPVVCDLWVSFDVLSCTASILNLCMISVDRYYAITKPLEYGVKRTPKRMIVCVSLVWLGAACISLPPLLILGNEHGTDGMSCSVCQNFGYQIYATLGSFYIPLSVMIVVYNKIFQAARKIVLEERRAQSHLRLTAEPLPPPPMVVSPLQPASASPPVLVDKIVVVTELSKNGNATPKTRLAPPLSGGGSWTAAGRSPEAQRHSTTSTVSSSSSDKERCFSAKRLRRNKQHDGEEPNTAPNTLKKCTNNDTSSRGGVRSKYAQPTNVISKSRLRFTLAKERKASTTLGIIMSVFTICWLPFFVLALVRPFLSDKNGIPQSLSSLFLWLGYANSLLNPIIYATLNKDFRKPFQQILYFRCSSLNLMMREEFYHSQYGDPTVTIGGPGGRQGGASRGGFAQSDYLDEEELQVLHPESLSAPPSVQDPPSTVPPLPALPLPAPASPITDTSSPLKTSPCSPQMPSRAKQDESGRGESFL